MVSLGLFIVNRPVPIRQRAEKGIQMLGDSFLSDAAWFFFAGWSVIIVVVSVAAFRRDLLSLATSGTRQAQRPSNDSVATSPPRK